MSKKLLNILSGKNAHMNRIWDAVFAHIANHLPQSHNAWIMVGILSNGVGQMVYDLDTKPLLKVDIKKLTTKHILQCMGIESGLLRRYSQLSQPEHFDKLEDFSGLIFPQASDAYLSLFADLSPPRLYLEYFTRYCEFCEQGLPQSHKPAFDMLTVMAYKEYADSILRSRVSTIATRNLQS